MRQSILREIRDRLEEAYGERLRGVMLYGSEARNRATADSDVDLLVLLQGPVLYARDVETGLEAVQPLARKLSRRISVKPVDAHEYESESCPLYEEVHREGMAL